MTTTLTRREALVGGVPVVTAAVVVVVAGAAHAGSARGTPADPTALRVSPGPARTGKLVVVDFAARTGGSAIEALSTTLGARAGTAFPTSADRRTWRALLPVEIEETARTLPLHADARRSDGTTTTTTRQVSVGPGRYDRRSITVGKQFTSPSQQEQERAERESEELAAALRRGSATRLWRGRFVRPTAGPETAPFGTLRTYNKKRKSRHLGLDLDGDVGAPIVAANRGRVLLAAERFYSGGTVLLDHGEGLVTLYFHMSRIDVVVDQMLERGAPLGAVGASGQVTGPHLHLTVKLGGCSVDPAQLLALDLSADVEQPPAAAPPMSTSTTPKATPTATPTSTTPATPTPP